MSWFYSKGGQQVGPVSDAQLDELLRSGEVGADTLVWREGMTEWQSVSAARAGSLPPISGSQSQSNVCAECGQTFNPGDLIRLGNSWVCARCKPIFLQKIAEGAATAKVGSIWRTGKQLVTTSETPFPDRCVKCNAPANGFRLKRVLYWQHPAYYFFLLCNILILLIVIMIVRKKAVLHVGLCELHRAKRKKIITIGWIGGLGGLALALIGGIAFQSVWPVLIGVIVFLGCALYGLIKAPMVSAAKITKENVWLKGAHPDFVAGFPEWSGP